MPEATMTRERQALPFFVLSRLMVDNPPQKQPGSCEPGLGASRPQQSWCVAIYQQQFQ